MNYPIPKRSADAWRTYQQTTRPHNPGLIFDRYSPDWRNDKEAKRAGFEAIIQAAAKVNTDLSKNWKARWKQVALASNAVPFPLKTDWRFVTGLGSGSPLEVGFTFNRYGFPILHGSGVKGVARAWALYEIAEMLNTTSLNDLDEILSTDDEDKYNKFFSSKNNAAAGERSDQFRLIFGTKGLEGGAIFFDAIPTGKPKLQLDTMTPHYSDYYGDKQNTVTPSAWQSPMPIPFMTVAPGTEFFFAMGWRTPLDDNATQLRGMAVNWLREGLTKLGAGAKTSAGYGYFK
jgi:CRISPR-associated protein Cmr6